MGISDDIKPKKIYRFKHEQNQEKQSPQPSSSVEEIEVTLEAQPTVETQPKSTQSKSNSSYEKKTELEDDFFQKEYNAIGLPHRESHKKNGFGKIISRVFLWIFLFALVGYAIYRDQDRIKKFLFSRNVKTEEKAESGDYYVAETDTTTDTSADKSTTPEAATTGTEKQVAEPAIVDKSTIKIEILNGNGIRGAADDSKDILEKAGYSISKVANAQRFTYSSTIIYYRTGAQQYAEDIKKTLSSRQSTLELSDAITKGYDIVIVIGKK